MTADEKASLARFIDLASARCGSGYLIGQTEYDFADDTDVMEAVADEPAADKPAADSLERVVADVRSCNACRLHETRKKAVPGEGFLSPLVMVIGEGPGADEDATGRPFVGKAGQLLDKMLAAIGLYRHRNCFIANVIKCRPPLNRDPYPEETVACASFLNRQIQILKPHFILCAGRVSAQTLLKTTDAIGKLRGKFVDFQCGDLTIPFIATYHPSALLRNEALKRPAWEDLKLLRSTMEEAGFGDRLQ
jgi:DNA polymerase